MVKVRKSFHTFSLKIKGLSLQKQLENVPTSRQRISCGFRAYKFYKNPISNSGLWLRSHLAQL